MADYDEEYMGDLRKANAEVVSSDNNSMAIFKLTVL